MAAGSNTAASTEIESTMRLNAASLLYYGNDRACCRSSSTLENSRSLDHLRW